MRNIVFIEKGFKNRYSFIVRIKKERGRGNQIFATAKRRIQLYGIDPSIIADIINAVKLRNGDQQIIKKVPGHTFPLKTVCTLNGPECIVITAYPLKKGIKK